MMTVAELPVPTVFSQPSLGVYMTNKNIYRFYVYAYLRSSDSTTAKAGTPYYIGKGTGGRAWDPKRVQKNAPKDHNYIVILESNLTELGAFALERRYIRWYGRKDNKTGILSNMTDGGEGVSGLVCKEETRRKLSIGRKGKSPSVETRKKLSISNRKPHPTLKGRKNSKEHNKNISISKTSVKHTEEHKKNNSLARLGVKRNPHTPETRAQISQSNSKPKPEGFGEIISKALTGRTLTEEHKNNIKNSGKGKERRTVKNLFTGEIYNIPKLNKTPYMHGDGAKAFRLVVIDEKYLTPSKNVLLEKFDITENQLNTWLMGKGSLQVNQIMIRCKTVDTRNNNLDELKKYEWVA
jgi:hypothetical protein